MLTLSPLAMGYTAAASAAFAFSALTGKKAAGVASPAAVMFVYMIPGMLVGVAWMALRPDGHFTSAYWPVFIVTWIANVAANLCYLRALKTSQASLAGCSLGLAPVFAALVARVALGETLEPHQWAGIVLSFVGLAAMYIPDKLETDIRHDYLAFFKTVEGWLMLGATLGWAVAAPFDKMAAAAASPQLHCILIYGAMMPPAFALLAAQGRLSELRLSARQLGAIFLSGSLRGTGFMFQLLALLITPVGVFEVLKRILLHLISLSGGKLLYGEEITKFKHIGTAIFFCAVPLVIFK